MNQPNSFVEILEFLVAPEQHMAFIEADRKIWTTGLAEYLAFDRKEVWVSADQPELIVCVIYWRDRAGWKEIDSQDLLEMGAAFDRAFPYPYQLVKEKEYLKISDRLTSPQPSPTRGEGARDFALCSGSSSPTLGVQGERLRLPQAKPSQH